MIDCRCSWKISGYRKNISGFLKNSCKHLEYLNKYSYNNLEPNTDEYNAALQDMSV